MIIHSDILTAVIFLVFGAASIAIGWGYGFGTLSALGAGAMPILAGAGLCFMGSVQLLQSQRAKAAGEQLISAFPRSEIRPLALILGAILAFAILIDRLGLLPTLVALIGISWFAERGGSKRTLLVVMLVIAALITGIFYFGLGIHFRLVSWRF